MLVLRKTVRAQFGARTGYALWLIPPLAVLASFLPPRVVQIVESLPPADAVPAGPEYILPPVAGPATAAAAAPEPVVAAAAFDPAMIALLVWLAGAAVMLAWLGRRQAQFMADVRAGKAGPAIVGFIYPYIVTPQDFDTRFSEGEQRVILAHENIHLNRHDAQINALVALIRCVCWYNPLVHVAAHCLRIDQELACDATVVERHPKARRLYADALLKAQLAARPLPLGCYWPAGTEHPLMERIEMLKRSAPGKLRRIAGAGLLVALTGSAGIAAWAAMPPETRVVFAYEQSPAPSQAAQKIDYAWENLVRVQGTVVSANLDGSPPMVLVRGTQVNPDPAPVEKLWSNDVNRTGLAPAMNGAAIEQLWSIDLTPKGRAPTQERDLAAAKIGTVVEIYGYRVDKACTSNCLLWARNFGAPPPKVAVKVNRVVGVPDTFNANFQMPIRIDGTVASIVRSGADYVVTIRGGGSLNSNLGKRPSDQPIAGDWTLTQFDGVANPRSPFSSGAALGMKIAAVGYPQKDATCTVPCKLAFVASNLMMRGGPGERRPVANPLYALQKIGPPADRRNDAPSPIAQPGFNAEDYVVVRGTIARVEGGDPIKTFWVKAREINRNYEETQANTDVWRVDRQTPGGASLSGYLRAGADIRVDGYVSTSCQPECRIQPMLIDLAQQQAATEYAPAAPQPIRFDQQTAPGMPNGGVPFAKYFDAEKPMLLKGKVEGKGRFENNTPMLLIDGADTANGSETRRWRVVLGPATTEDLLDRLAGQTITVRGYRAKDESCDSGCLMSGRDIKLDTGEKLYPGTATGAPRSVAPAKPAATLQPIRYEPQSAAAFGQQAFAGPDRPNRIYLTGKRGRFVFSTLPPPDAAPELVERIDAGRDLMLRGTVTGVETSGDNLVLTISGRSLSASFGAEQPEAREWRVAVGRIGPSRSTLRDATNVLRGQDVSVRGLGLKDDACEPGCEMIARDVTVTSEVTLRDPFVPL